MIKNFNKGITLVEIMVIIAILLIITAMVVPNLNEFKRQRALKNTLEDVVSLLSEARNNTISSKNSRKYGVYFEENRATLFVNTYTIDASTNKQILFDNSVHIPSSGGLNLNGGTSSVIFDKITGDTSGYGTIKIQLLNDSNIYKIINISKIGVISTN